MSTLNYPVLITIVTLCTICYHNILLGVHHNIQSVTSTAITTSSQSLLSNVQKKDSVALSEQHNLMVMLEHILLTIT